MGTCHVETKSLDGETNLKGRTVAKQLLNLVGATPAHQLKAVANLRGHVECEQPNAATTKFTGKVLVEGHDAAVLSINNVLLLSPRLRAVYAPWETRHAVGGSFVKMWSASC